MPVKCENPDCNKRASYNFSNELKALYCKDHILDGMIDVRNKRCNNPDCNTHANYNFSNETKALYCKDHIIDGMIDVINKNAII